jgi:acyl-CoA thioester hydrolase
MIMARIKLTIPPQNIAEVQVPVRITDINYGNHLGNGAVVNILHEARMQWLQDHGFTELDVAGCGLIMADLAVEFKAEGFYGDTITVKISCGDIGRVGFDLYYALLVVRNGQTIVLALAKTGMVCYDYNIKKVAPVNDILRQLLQPKG